MKAEDGIYISMLTVSLLKLGIMTGAQSAKFYFALYRVMMLQLRRRSC